MMISHLTLVLISMLGGTQVTNKRSQQENITDERGITEILESGIFQASFAVSRFRFSNGVVTPIAPPGEHNNLYSFANSLALATCPFKSGLRRAPCWHVCISTCCHPGCQSHNAINITHAVTVEWQ